MENKRKTDNKRKSADSQQGKAKRTRHDDDDFEFTEKCKTGKIKKILVHNFMCHDALEVKLNPNVNFIVGQNGSGKSAILTALTVGLGARANVTSRGASVQNFVQKGKKSATIEITLHNKGLMAYKPDVYGDSITVVRTIGSGSSYKIKNEEGELVTTKRNELSNILRTLNIQIDNPISILNQDVSRTFLSSSKPEEKYELFMRATLLDIIGANYKEAQVTCQAGYEKLKIYNNIVAETSKEMEQLKSNIKKAEKVVKYRQEASALEVELLWAKAIESERKLEEATNACQRCENNLEQLKSVELTIASRGAEIDQEIQKLEDSIKEETNISKTNSDSYYQAKQEYTMKKNEQCTKNVDLRSIQSAIKRSESNIVKVKQEIHRLENENEVNEMRQQLEMLKQKLDETDALLTTKETHRRHLETDKLQLLGEIQASKIKISDYNQRLEKMQHELYACKKNSHDALTVYGHKIPRLLKRIEEEYNKHQFKEKPRGPLGAHIKIKEREWAPAIEYFLSNSLLSAFCVDNEHDAKILTMIMKEIFMNELPPKIICSKFFHRVHNVSDRCATSSLYSNLLNMMEISDPVVANCLIDQREVECIMLIPSSKDAARVMSDVSRVPRNCKRAFTLQGDTFYPEPNYRTYGGPSSLKARYLQVSTKDVINTLEEEIRNVQKEKEDAVKSYNTSYKKEICIMSELNTVVAEVAKLFASQNRYKLNLADLEDKINEAETRNLTVFKNELPELQQKLLNEKQEEANLNKSMVELEKAIGALAEDIKRLEKSKQESDAKIASLKMSVKKLEREKEDLHAKYRIAPRKLEGARQHLQQAKATVEQQQRCTEKALSSAQSRCKRIQTERSCSEIQRSLNELLSKISEIERQIGNMDELRKLLQEKETKYGKEIRLLAKIESVYQAHLKRLEKRKNTFNDMKKMYGENIQYSFENILKLRNRKGTISIDHSRKVVNLEVHSSNDDKNPVSDTRSLSGGERSYSTVAFILALWDCTKLPFYFLDEFDVFMDKINRKTIMDILLEHARTHSESQYTFLTPLDTSAVQVDDYITIHKMSPPVRGTQE